MRSATLAMAVLGITVSSLLAQEIRRATPATEPPTPPAVPFDFDKPAPTPTPKPAAPKPVATPTESNVSPASQPRSDGSISYTTPDEVQLDYANGLYAQKLYDAAAPEFEKYLGQFPNAAGRQVALFRAGECYRALNNASAARSSYETLVSSFQVGEFVGPGAYRLADLYFRDKNYTGALPLFRKAARLVKDPAVTLTAKFYLARCLENLRSISEARLTYEEVLAVKENNPFREASRFSLAQIFSDAGRKAEAVKQFDVLATEAEKPAMRAEALIQSALLKIDLNQADKAAADLSKAMAMPEIGAWKGVAEVALLRTLFMSGKYAEVVKSYEVGSAEYPSDAQTEVMLLAANSYRQTGNHAKARALYAKIIADSPATNYAKDAQYERLVSLYADNDAALVPEIDAYLAQNGDPERRDRVTLLKAEALYKQGQYAAAAPVYARLDGSSLPAGLRSEAQFRLGWCHMQTKEFDAAIKDFTTFLTRYSSDKLVASARVQRAIAEQQVKNYAEALKDFNEVISRFPKAKERELALQQKALILGQQEDNAGMIETFRLLLREYPKTAAAAQANYWIGWAAFEAKDYKKAIAPLEAARELDSEQFFERATLRIILAHRYLENRDALGVEVDRYAKEAPKGKVPAEVLRWLGGQFLTDKKYEPAERYFGALVKRETDSVPDDWLNFGRSQLEQKEYSDAVVTLRSFLEKTKQPTAQAYGYLGLGEALLGTGKFEEAQKAADQACSLQTEGKLNAFGRMLSGDIAFARGDFTAASKIYLSISVIIDDSEVTPRALEKACVALKKSGDDKQAAKVLNELQSRYPEYPVKLAEAP